MAFPARKIQSLFPLSDEVPKGETIGRWVVRPPHVGRANTIGREMYHIYEFVVIESKCQFSADLPGVKKEDIHINVENGVITIFGKITSRERVKRAEKDFIKPTEVNFSRRLRIPEGVKEGSMKSISTDGALKVNMKFQKKTPVEVS